MLLRRAAAAICLFVPAVALAKPATDPDPARFPRRTRWVPSPCPGPTCTAVVPAPTPDAKGLRTVFLNFDGVTLTASNTNDDARTNVSAIAYRNMTVPPFDPSDLYDDEGLTRAQIIARVVDQMYEIHAPYNMEFVTTRPASGTYQMIVFGGSCLSVVGDSGCAGIALGDCGDYLPANITFAFPENQRVDDLAPTAAQEAAHAFGVGHTDDRYDVMYPQIQLSIIPDHFGAGNVPDDSGCGASYQNSHQRMLDIIGARGADTTVPDVSITTPANGSVVTGGTSVEVTAEDNIAVDRVEMWIDNSLVKTDSESPYQFVLSGTIASGQHRIEARAYDLSDNMAADGVVVTVPAATPECDNDDDCEDDEHCEAQTCIPDVIDDPADGTIGDICTGADDCMSHLCGTVSGESRCTQACDDSNPCPDGFKCLSDTACWPSEEDPDDEGGGGGGCAVGSGGSAPGAAGGTLALLGIALVLSARRRRR